jgi:predicted nuclease with TOPRIM domain
MKEKEDYFIKIANPKATRKEVLENTRDVLKILQGYEEFKKIRKERSELIDSFKLKTNEIKNLVHEMKRIIPKANVSVKKTIIARQEVSKAPVEIKRIEQELAEIEAKLNEL